MKLWTKGLIALIGDAAACILLPAGEGIGLVMVEAYVFANPGSQEKFSMSLLVSMVTGPI
jgi:hypothetical protein